MQKYCINCGTGSRQKYRFCPKCGRPFLKEVSVPTSSHQLDIYQKAFLSLFLKPRELVKVTRQIYWVEVFQKPLQKIIQELIASGLLTRPNTKDCILKSFRIADLKPILKHHRLKVSGKKEELVDRLIEHQPLVAQKLTESVDLFLCTESAIEIVKEWLTRSERERENYEVRTRKLIENCKYREAFSLYESFFESIPEPTHWRFGGRHIQPSWDDFNIQLSRILETGPETDPSLTKQEFEKAKNDFILTKLWGLSSVEISEGFKLAARMRIRYHQEKQILENFRAGGIKKVQIYAVEYSCQSCKQLENRPFIINNAPIIPNPACTSEYGCRCTYAPVHE